MEFPPAFNPELSWKLLISSLNCNIQEVISKFELIKLELNPNKSQQSAVNVWTIKFLSVKTQQGGASPYSFQEVGKELCLLINTINTCFPSSAWTKWALNSNCFKKLDLVLQYTVFDVLSG